MGYLHIPNLYRPEAQDIFLFKKAYAMEKVHGTSAHLSYNEGQLGFFSGGEKHENFVKLFDQEALRAGFEKLGCPKVIVFGEAYGGKQQGMSATYGKELRFIVFDVKIDENWLTVDKMDKVATELGLEVVPWSVVDADPQVLDALRDAPSEVAVRRGCGADRPREGIVIRPLVELRKNNGERVIAKHKGEKFSERVTPQKTVDPEKLRVYEAAQAIAEEWVTPMRLEHVLDKLPEPKGIEQLGAIIKAMIEDVYREARGEIVESKDAEKAIGAKTAKLFKKIFYGLGSGGPQKEGQQ